MARKSENNSKEEIIRTAFVLFLENGFKKVTLKNIMDETGLSKGAIYHHFKSKDEIYEATLHNYYFDLINIDTSTFATGNFKDDVSSMYLIAVELFDSIERLKEGGLQFPIRNFVSYQLESEINDEVRGMVMIALTKYRKAVKKLVQLAIDTKQIRADIDAEGLAFQIITIIEGIAVNHSTVQSNVAEVLKKRYDQVFEGFFKMVCIE